MAVYLHIWAHKHTEGRREQTEAEMPMLKETVVFVSRSIGILMGFSGSRERCRDRPCVRGVWLS
jgi:hypothetical protein